MTVDFNGIVKALPSLNANERAQLRQRLSVLDSLTGEQTHYAPVGTRGTSDNLVDRVLRIIVNVCSDKGLAFEYETRLRKAADFKTFSVKVKELEPFLTGISKRSIDQDAIVRIGVELILDHLLYLRVGVTARTLMRHIHKLPTEINKAFPGYVRSGILLWLVKPR